MDSGEVDEALADQVDDYEASDLDERHKVALRLTDAMILDPSAADEALRADARRLFSEEEIAELLLDVVKWSQQKASVALRIEVPPREGLSELGFDDQGQAASAARQLTPLVEARCAAPSLLRTSPRWLRRLRSNRLETTHGEAPDLTTAGRARRDHPRCPSCGHLDKLDERWQSGTQLGGLETVAARPPRPTTMSVS